MKKKIATPEPSIQSPSFQSGVQEGIKQVLANLSTQIKSSLQKN